MLTVVFWGCGGVGKVMVVFAEGGGCWVAGWKKEDCSVQRRENWVWVCSPVFSHNSHWCGGGRKRTG